MTTYDPNRKSHLLSSDLRQDVEVRASGGAAPNDPKRNLLFLIS